MATMDPQYYFKTIDDLFWIYVGHGRDNARCVPVDPLPIILQDDSSLRIG